MTQFPAMTARAISPSADVHDRAEAGTSETLTGDHTLAMGEPM
jgi:hypothetical protein